MDNTQEIILDSNILQYISSKISREVLISFLQELWKNYTFIISSFTKYELLRGIDKKKEAEVAQLFQWFENYPVTDDILENAAKLESLYQLDNISPNQISSGDSIIATSAIITNSLILTANARDFPHPYFIEVERKLLEFEMKNKRYKSIVISLLQPDFSVIIKRMEELE